MYGANQLGEPAGVWATDARGAYSAPKVSEVPTPLTFYCENQLSQSVGMGGSGVSSSRVRLGLGS